jgi:hypothetical protein
MTLTGTSVSDPNTTPKQNRPDGRGNNPDAADLEVSLRERAPALYALAAQIGVLDALCFRRLVAKPSQTARETYHESERGS